jgi:hypothetical protein
VGKPIGVVVGAGRDLADRDHQQRDREHGGEGHQQVPGDEGPGAARHHGVEGVVEAVAELGSCGHVDVPQDR